MKDNQMLPVCEASSVPLRSQANPPFRILVAEDDIAIRQLNTESLSLCGYQVDAAADGAIAWDALQFNCYDLLVTDNNMPKVSGLELLKKLRAACMAVPVIMVTGTSLDEEFTRYPWLRPAAMLLKPFTMPELLKTVEAVLRATDSGCERIAPPPNCQSRASANGLQAW